jgi:hypothetical protein
LLCVGIAVDGIAPFIHRAEGQRAVKPFQGDEIDFEYTGYVLKDDHPGNGTGLPAALVAFSLMTTVIMAATAMLTLTFAAIYRNQKFRKLYLASSDQDAADCTGYQQLVKDSNGGGNVVFASELVDYGNQEGKRPFL